MIEFPDDFRDLLVELSDAGASFVLLGGHAVAYHGHPRGTQDLDALIEATADNSIRVYRALASYGASLDAFDVSADDFASYDDVLQLGLPPRRVDIINRADGIRFEDAVADGETVEVAGRQIPIIGWAALLQNKRASGRPKDLADVEALEALVRAAREE